MKILLLGLILLSITLSACSTPKRKTDCKFSIVGGGVAGVYLAYKLAPKYGESLCLFEKEKELGGRLTDEKLGLSDSDAWVGTGARRVNDVQSFVLNLGKELGLKFQTPDRKHQLIHTKKRMGHNADDFVKDFPGLIGPLDQDPSTSREDEIYTLLLKEREQAKKYPDLKNFITAVAGVPALNYLSAMSRFHGDFQYDISSSNYLETLEEEYQLSSINHYPVGGMSAFIRAMEVKLKEERVSIYKDEAILEMEEKDEIYFLKTNKRISSTEYLVIATPPSGLNYIQGKVAEEIKQTKEYQALLPIPIVVINQWWKKAWWDKHKVWRAWSNDQCVNHVEIPQEEYAAKGKVTRSVYTDDRECVKHWQEVMKMGGIPALEKELSVGLSRLFKIKIPKPIKTSMHYWSAGWYYIKSGSNFINADIVKWALEPIPGKKNLSLVGESYWPNRPGWTVGAYSSVDIFLSNMK